MNKYVRIENKILSEKGTLLLIKGYFIHLNFTRKFLEKQEIGNSLSIVRRHNNNIIVP